MDSSRGGAGLRFVVPSVTGEGVDRGDCRLSSGGELSLGVDEAGSTDSGPDIGLLVSPVSAAVEIACTEGSSVVSAEEALGAVRGVESDD